MVRKTIILTQIPYCGIFQYKDVFKIYPYLPKPDSNIQDIPSILEFSVDPLTMKRIDVDDINLSTFLNSNKGDIFTESHHEKTFQNELLRLLSLFTNYYHFVYSLNQSWFIPISIDSNDIPSPVWGQQMPPSIECDFENGDFQAIEFKESLKYFGDIFLHRVTNSIVYPDDITQLLDCYFSLKDNDKETFDKSIRLFYQGLILRKEMKSMSIVAFISSIETLVSYDNRNNPVDKCKCGEIKYGVTKKFKVFVAGSISTISTSEPSKFVNKIYDLRSKIVHAGSLHIGDLDRGFWDSTDITDPFIIDDIEQAARVSLIHWLKKPLAITSAKPQ